MCPVLLSGPRGTMGLLINHKGTELCRSKTINWAIHLALRAYPHLISPKSILEPKASLTKTFHPFPILTHSSNYKMP